MGDLERCTPVETGFQSSSLSAWTEETTPARRVERAFATWGSTLRFLAACVGAELAQDERYGFAAAWFRGPGTVGEMHRTLWTAVRNERPPMGAAAFPILAAIAAEPGTADHLRGIVGAWELWRRGAVGPFDLECALAPRLRVLAARLGALERLGLMTVWKSRPCGGAVEWVGMCASPPARRPAPAAVRADRAAVPGAAYLMEGDRPIAGMDPWVLVAECPLCKERHFFLLDRPGDSASRYGDTAGPCAVIFPLGRQALMERLAGPSVPPLSEGCADKAPEPPPMVGMRLSRRFHRIEPAVRALAWSGDGRRLASGGGDGAIRLDDYETGEPLILLKHRSRSIAALAWSPDERRLAAGGAEGSIAVWETAGWTVRASVEGAFLYPVTALAWSPSGALCASAHAEPRVWLWDPAGWKVQGWLEGHGEGAASLAWCDHRRLATGGADGRLRCWDAYARKLLWETTAHAGGVRAMLTSPDGLWVASAGADGMLKVWEAATGEWVREARAHPVPVAALTTSCGGAYLASRGDDGRVRLWDVQRWEALADLDVRPGPGGPLQFHPFLPLLAAADPWERRVQVYRIEGDAPDERSDWGARRKAC